MRSLIIDQSASCFGFAILEDKELLDHGTLTSLKKGSTSRLLEFWGDLKKIVATYGIGELVFERVHYHGLQNRKTIYPQAAAEFICQAVAEKYRIPWYFIWPQSWKAAASVRGKGSENQKRSARERACQRWGLETTDIKSYDHSDALCIAAYWVIYREDYRLGLVE